MKENIRKVIIGCFIIYPIVLYSGNTKYNAPTSIFELFEKGIRDFTFFGDALTKARAIAQDDELYLAAGACLIYPAG